MFGFSPSDSVSERSGDAAERGQAACLTSAGQRWSFEAGTPAEFISRGLKKMALKRFSAFRFGHRYYYKNCTCQNELATQSLRQLFFNYGEGTWAAFGDTPSILQFLSSFFITHHFVFALAFKARH